MFARLFSFIFYIIAAFFVWSLVKLVFNMGRTSAEFSRRAEEMKRKSASGGKKQDKNVIELNRDQYKVE